MSIQHGLGVVLHVWKFGNELVQLAMYVLGLLLVVVPVVFYDQGSASRSDLVVITWFFVPVLSFLGSFQEVFHVLHR